MRHVFAAISILNFANMPELETRFGYGVVLIAIAATCIGLCLRFKIARLPQGHGAIAARAVTSLL